MAKWRNMAVVAPVQRRLKVSLPAGRREEAGDIDPCPLCGARLRIKPVNVSRCTNVGGPWKTIRVCGACREFADLSTKTMRQWRSG